MRIISAVGRIAAVSFLVSLTFAPAGTEAGVVQCGNAITRWSVNFAKSRVRALRKCEEDTVQDQQPPGTNCYVAGEVVGELAEKNAKLIAEIRDACGGHNRTCNAGDTGIDADVPLASIGWDIGVCPDFEGAGCTNPIGHCGDIADCLACIGVAAGDQAVALPYGSLVLPTRDTDPVLNRCQITLGKESIKFLTAKVSALRNCETKVRRGKITGPCPDAKTAGKITNLHQKLVAKICDKCGGTDETCDGVDDLAPSTIGFPSTCPSVTVPSGPSCGGNVTTLDELVTCVDCVMEFKADCVARISALDVTSYPTECTAIP